MLRLVIALVVVSLVSLPLDGEEKNKVPSLTVKSADGKETYDILKLVEKGPVLVRLTCACRGCDIELPFFQKLQTAYEKKGLRTLAIFREDPDFTKKYVAKNKVKFLWAVDPAGKTWKIFDTKTMPTNILVDKGGKVVRVLKGCSFDGRNAQKLSRQIAEILDTPEVQIFSKKDKKLKK